MTSTKHPVDVHVGARVQVRRKAMGLSQTKLGQGVGLTFQQIQKYESGANRISASKLWEIASHLNTSVMFFYEGLEQKSEHDVVDAFMATDDGRAVAKSMTSLSDTMRSRVIELINGITRDQAQSSSSS